MDDLETLHTELQSKLKEVTKISDLLPYISKTETLEALKVQISAKLQQQLTAEKKALESSKPKPEPTDETTTDKSPKPTDDAPATDTKPPSTPSIIRDLYTLLTTQAKEKEEDEKDNKLMKPRQIEDDDNKSADNVNNTRESNRGINYMRDRGYGPPSWSTSVCYNCGEKGHFARECPAKRRYNSRGGGGRGYGSNNLRCYHCGKDGHFARDCPEESNDELNEKCFRCGKMGHWARNCDMPPKERDNVSGGGGGRNSYNNSNDKCHRCGKIGHWAKDCDKPYQYQGNFKQNDKCNRCGKLGHWARECDLPRNDGYNDDY